jgi:hypothetical protein
MSTKSREDLEGDFSQLEKDVRAGTASTGGTDTRAILGILLLGIAIVKLDRTSSRLSLVNIFLGVALLIAAAIQICLMVHAK